MLASIQQVINISIGILDSFRMIHPIIIIYLLGQSLAVPFSQNLTGLAILMGRIEFQQVHEKFHFLWHITHLEYTQNCAGHR